MCGNTSFVFDACGGPTISDKSKSPVLQVPFDDEEKLRDWMYAVYKEKDEMLGKSF